MDCFLTEVYLIIFALVERYLITVVENNTFSVNDNFHAYFIYRVNVYYSLNVC